MSLDVYLNLDSPQPHSGSGIFIRENGSTKEISRKEWDERFPGIEPIVVQGDDESNCVFSANITHNLGKMAKDAGIYEFLWRPEEVGVSTAKQLIDPLKQGLALLKGQPARFKKLNPSNGWGDYGGLVNFVEQYLDACMEFPEAKVRVWR